jgi:hypothetical protein
LIDALREMRMSNKCPSVTVRCRFVPARWVICAALAAACAASAAQSGPLLPPRTGEPLQRAQPQQAPTAQPVEATPGTRLQTRPPSQQVGASPAAIAFGQISPAAARLLAQSEYAAASWQACLYDALRQGLPMQVAITLCEIRLWQDDKRGWGDAGIASAVFRQPPPAPNTFGACASGADPKLTANPYATVGNQTLVDLSVSISEALRQVRDRATQANLKAELRKIDLELDKRMTTGKSVPDLPRFVVTIGEIEFVPVETDAKSAAGGKPAGGSKQRTDPDSLCAQAVAQAQAFLRECQRTGWKTGACQAFQARVKRCPDPRLAYVDPGAGYACGESADPKLVAEAYAKKCEQLARPGPDGRNPCQPQAPEGDARAIKGAKDLCNDPNAYHTGEGCVAELVVPNPAGFQRGGSVQEVLTIATTRLGGPVFVLPKPAPAPSGPQPMPGPQPSTGPRGTASGPLLQPPPGGAR